MLEKRRENYRRLENLHTKLLEESKRICERTHGADGELMPESLVRALDAWTEDDDRSRRERLAQAVCGVRPAKLRGRELADALVRSVQEVRRYDENTVLNLYICWAQNFLTVLSGEPGSGKTSICHILARTLGLDAFDNLLSSDERAGLSAGRFVHVPVEYGWTSKRDFVGYWNPITNRFESSDPARWDLLRTLDAEERSASGSVYPAMMLLDEANLSPMEYYWSDWMRLCDEQTSSGIVTLWDKAPTKVPETLRFMATINNDSTTETLSPRLIDRAAVVTLPVVDCIENTSPAKVVGPVSWKELQAYFGAKAVSKNARELSDLHDRLMPMLEGFGIRLSPRSIRQMNGYVGAALLNTFIFRRKEDDGGNEEIVRLWYQPVLAAGNVEPENGIGLARTTRWSVRPLNAEAADTLRETDRAWYSPDFLISLESGGRTAWAVMDSKYSTVGTVLRHHAMQQAFKYLTSLGTVRKDDVYAGLWLYCGSVANDRTQEGSFFNASAPDVLPVPDMVLERVNALSEADPVAGVLERLRTVLAR